MGKGAGDGNLDQAVAALLGAFIGASAGVTGGVALEMYKRRRDRQGAASALSGEIGSILHMTKRRNYVQTFELFLPMVEAGHDIKIPNFAPDGDYYDRVAEKHIDRPRNALSGSTFS